RNHIVAAAVERAGACVFAPQVHKKIGRVQPAFDAEARPTGDDAVSVQEKAAVKIDDAFVVSGLRAGGGQGPGKNDRPTGEERIVQSARHGGVPASCYSFGER